MLAEIIKSLSKEEKRHISLFLSRTHKQSERKDKILFDYYTKNDVPDSDDFIAAKLYGKSDKNAFYRLRNRLLEDILQAQLEFHGFKTSVQETQSLLILADVYISKKQAEKAVFLLKKAEKLALQSENLEALDAIYTRFISLSDERLDINPEVYISLRDKNAEQVRKTREMDTVFKTLHYKMRLSQNLGKQEVTVSKLLKSTLKNYVSDQSLQNSKLFQTKIYQVVSQFLLKEFNYQELESITSETYQMFEQKKWFDKDNHRLKLQMLVYLMNAAFKNNRSEDSVHYTEKLKPELSAFNEIHYNDFVFFYYNGLIINHSKTDPARALQAVTQLEKELSRLPNPYYGFFTLLNKSILLYRLKRFNEAVNQLYRLYINDHFKKSDAVLKWRIVLCEIIFQYESGDYMAVKKRIGYVRKEQQKNQILSWHTFETYLMDFIEVLSDKGGKMDKKDILKLNKLKKESTKPSITETQIIDYGKWIDRILVA